MDLRGEYVSCEGGDVDIVDLIHLSYSTRMWILASDRTLHCTNILLTTNRLD